MYDSNEGVRRLYIKDPLMNDKTFIYMWLECLLTSMRYKKGVQEKWEEYVVSVNIKDIDREWWK